MSEKETISEENQDSLKSLETIKDILEEDEEEIAIGKIKSVIESFFQKKEETTLSDLLPALSLIHICKRLQNI